MAAVVEMGEVDDMHAKEEGGLITNGDLSNDIDMEAQESQDGIKPSSLPESMEVDEVESNEAKESHEQISTTEESTEDIENTIEENAQAEEKEITTEENETTAEENETAEESSPETDNNSEINEDDSSQGTEKSEGQVPERTDSGQKNDTQLASDDERSKNSDDVRSKVSEDGKSRISDDEKSKLSEDEKSKLSEDENSKLDENDSSSGNKNSIAEDHEQDRPNDSFSQIVIEQVHTVKEEDEIHEIVSDDEETGKDSKHNNHETIEVDDSGGEDDGDVMFVEESETPKENGTEVIELLETPEKKPAPIQVVTPRRSSRNLNKNKSYAEIEKEATPSPQPPSEESDIEEVLPQDPLACNDAITVERISEKPKPVNKPSTIVVKDTKRLVEIASKSSNSSPSTTPSGKKEPTLVIIDTNSILSGRGPVPVNNKAATSQTQSSIQSQAVTNQNYSSILPMALPAQGMYPPNMRATITPIPMSSTTIGPAPQPKSSPATITPSLTTPLLPTLTDDMFVVEAPSFIVPYVYEKPPVKDFKSFVKELQDAEKKQDKVEKKSEIEVESDIKPEKNEDEEPKDEEKMDVSDEQKSEKVPGDEPKKEVDDAKKPYSYFDSPLGKFFINIGFNLVQEFVQSDLLKQQKRKASREGGSNPETEKTIKSLVKNLELSKENNEPFKSPIKKCEFCNFKTESAHVMAYHLETPHMKNFVYKCNFCPYEVRNPHDILFHMEAEHAVRAHLERAPAFHQCPSCPFEDNQKGKMSRHLVACMKKFKPERNLEPPIDWEPPAKIPRVPKMRQQGLNATAAAYQALSKSSQYQFLSKMQLQNTQQVLQRGRGRPQLGTPAKPSVLRPSGMVFKQQAMSGGSVLVPTNYQLSGNQVFQNANQQKKPTQQPSISITPLPRPTQTTPAKPGDTTSKNSFVICEICDGYIKDLEQLRNHMQWIHKIKIHPKMIYNRPPLNCQKCQFRFFTDQGLERHLLGSHGLVTSSMQDAANKSKDSGRCPVCGRVYQWKLLNHVARDHNMTLKPAHLSYKCTVCTATFGMYKQFENHVYSAHSVVAKRVMDKKGNTNSSSPTANKTDLKPLKINDEITIIPQPTKSSNGSAAKDSSSGSSTPKNNTPSTSKNSDAATPSTSRAERLARRTAYEDA